ncbi:MAG: 2'-5' RNA ligase family protein [Chloroflexi bacterium]|nr:MAG: 2'-5' RNA ligase family protein [Chloroflexota bacterium]
MDGLLTILDQPHYQKIESIKSDLNERFYLFDPALPFHPHFSYHVAESYNEMALRPLMQQLARETAVFTLKANGIGIFPGPEPTLYIPLTRTQTLNNFHQKIWSTINPLCQDSVTYYHPENWFPHISIGPSSIPVEKLGPAVQWLNQQNLFFETKATNLSFFRQAKIGYKLAYQYIFEN